MYCFVKGTEMKFPQNGNTKSDQQKNDDIAIIGMSGKFPGANDLNQFWDNLIEKKHSVTEIPLSRWNWKNYYGEGNNQTTVKWGSFIEGIDQFDAEFFNISVHEAELMDPQQRIFLETIWKTIEDAGYTKANLSSVKTGLFVGVASNDYRELLIKASDTSAYVATGNAYSALANRVSCFLGINGPSEPIDTDCSSSLMALHNAVKAIHNGDCEMALVGGVNAILTPSLHLIFSQAGMLSRDGQNKIFDKSADGYVRGEGVGAILLKPLSKAVADGDVIHGVIKGTAVNYGGHVNSLAVPNPNAQAELIISACERAKISIDTIGYIETGTTGTALGDPTEIEGLKQAFTLLLKSQAKTHVSAYYCGLSSVKTNIGHLEAASGMAGIIKVMLAMRHGKIPANINFTELNPAIDLHDSPFYIVQTTQEWTRVKDKNGQEIPLRAGVNAFGSGGANAHVILEEAPVLNARLPQIKPYYLVTLSAKTNYSLQQRQLDLAAWLKTKNELPSLENISYTLNVGREHCGKRCAFVVTSILELQETLKQVENNQKPANYLWSIEEENPRREPVFDEILEKILDDMTNYETWDTNTYRNKLLSLGDLYIKGYDIDWKRLHHNESRYKISLPTYPFVKKRFWIPESDSIITLPAQPTKQESLPASSFTNEIRNNLKDIIAKVVKIKKSSIDDDKTFDQYNIDSLFGLQIIKRIKSFYNIELETNSLLLHPTLAGIANLIEETIKANGAENMRDIQYVPVLQGAPANHEPFLSLGQERMYFNYLLEPSVPSYNCTCTLQFDGTLNVDALKNACLDLVNRHNVLRSVFVNRDGKLSCYIQSEESYKIDFSFVVNKKNELNILIEQETNKLFDLTHGPLIRFTVVQTDQNRYVIIISCHHIITDGLSFVIIIKELAAFYSAYVQETVCQLPSLAMQYADFSSWQREWIKSDAAKQQLDILKGNLANVSALNLPTDKKRPLVANHTMHVHAFKLSASIVEQLIYFSKLHKVTIFTCFFTVYQLFISQYTKQKDFVTGVLASGRDKEEFEYLIGFFVNILPLHIDLSGSHSFLELIKRVSHAIHAAFPHQNLPIEMLISELKLTRKAGINPLFQTVFVFQNYFPKEKYNFSGLETKLIDVYNGISNDDIVFEVRKNGNDIDILFKYNTSLFFQSTIEKMANHFVFLLEKMLIEPERSIDDSSLLPALSQKKKIIIGSSFTIEPINESMQFWQDKLNLAVDFEFAPYNQLFQEFLNPASYFRSNLSGINIALIRLEDWLMHQFSYQDLKQSVDELLSALKKYTATAHAPLIIHVCLPSPQFLEKFAEEKLYEAFENKIAEAIKEMAGIYLISAKEMKNYGINDYYDPITDASGHLPFTPVYFAALGTELIRKIVALLNKPYKVLVLDCDNTLWQGVLGEDGPEGVRVSSGYFYLQSFVVKQYEAGVLICLCSKNDENDVLEFFDKNPTIPLKKSHLTAWQINWRPKSENIRQLAIELGLGLDSFIFIDDNPVECEEVRANCPEVLTLQLPGQSESIPAFLQNVWALDHVRVTEMDKQRSLLYQQNIGRERERKNTQSFSDFIASLQLDITLSPLSDKDIPRVAELTQRTNQFNTTTVRKNDALINAFCESKANQCLVVFVKDRFGTYGLVGAVFYKLLKDTLEIENFLLSCRVLGKGVEHKIISELGKIAESHHLSGITICYIATERNTPARLFLDSLPAKVNDADYSLLTSDAIKIQFRPESPLAEETSRPVVTKISDEVNNNILLMDSLLAQEIAAGRLQPHTIIEIIHSQAERQRLEGTHIVSPHSDTEKKIAAILKNLLHLDHISIHDNFFELGGTSLLMVQAQSELNHVLGYLVPLLEFFNHPSIESLAAFLDGGKNQEESYLHEEKEVTRELGARRKKLRDRFRSGDLDT
jgi:FkbH-like protein